MKFQKEINFISNNADEVFINLLNTKKTLKHILKNHFSINKYIINFIFIDSQEITSINKKYLKHNTPTDVIIFDFSVDFGFLAGDIYICPYIVSANSVSYKTTPQKEMLRVIVHGILHLLGFRDCTKNEQKAMRIKEEEILRFFEPPNT